MFKKIALYFIYLIALFFILTSTSCEDSGIFITAETGETVESIADIGGKPDGVTIDSQDNYYVTDIGNGAIKKVGNDGVVTTISTGEFNHPDGITVSKDDDNVLYVTDTGSGDLGDSGDEPYASNNDGVVKKVEIAEDGTTTVTTLVDSTILNSPTGIATDNEGSLYVADETNSQVYKIKVEEGVAQDPVPLTEEGTLNKPHGLALVTNADNSISLITTDQGNNNVVKIDLPSTAVDDDITSADTTITNLTPPSTDGGFEDGDASKAKFNKPHGVGVDNNGAIFVSDEDNNRVRIITPGGNVATFAGDGTAGDETGNAYNAQFEKPRGLAVDSSGDVLICDYENGKVKKIEK
ncbi:MAG: hypothetical protein JW782_00470 [Candidatus Saganbacteria bacterium]|nr:hypothetical protein [Candidatus Saganbacteria bacterium]